MTERLQSFGFQDSPYERVERGWHCGRTEGASCLSGPDHRGRCGGRFACRPVRDASGEGHRCARLHEEGGACPEGPGPDGTCAHALPPCRPVRSVRGRRGVVVRTSFAFTLGLLLLLLFGPARDAFVDPGELAAAHARLELSCADCHAAAGADTGTWLERALAGDTGMDVAARCGACHVFSAQEAALHPHGLSAAQLDRSRQAASPRGRAEPRAAQARLGCGACHREHQGRAQRLVSTTDPGCTTCHASVAGFGPGRHPEFGDAWPHARRDPVGFDHKAHYGGLFAQGATAAGASAGTWQAPACTACHQPDVAARDMRARFENHCAPCHGGRMSYAGGSAHEVALRFVQLPWFDEGARPDGWSEELGAMDPSEIVISPEMRILLGRDRDTYTRLLARLPEGERTPFGFLELGADARAEVGAFLQAIRHLLAELGQADRAQALGALARRVEASTGHAPEGEELQRLWPPALQRRAGQAHAAWFGGPPTMPETKETRFAIDAERFSLDLVPRYDVSRPDRSHGDVTLEAWLTLVLRFMDGEHPLRGEDAQRRIAPGLLRCLKCHNVDRDADGALGVAWDPARSSAVQLARFAHAPHLGLDLEGQGIGTPPTDATHPGWIQSALREADPHSLRCLRCHVATDADVHDDFFVHFFPAVEGRPTAGRSDPRGAAAGFAPIGQALCAACHASGRAPSDCLACHVYHGGPRATRARLPAPAPR